MEVLKVRDMITGVSIVLAAGSIGWIVTTLIEVDKRTAVTVVKVEENHKMIHTLWIDFINRKINCKRPKGFSEKAHCASKKRRGYTSKR